MEYTPTIGLEIHVELKTKTKMFCDCPNDPDEIHPNVNICPVCLGYPGTLPVANKLAIEYVLKTGFALGCENPKISKFDRKNYFYPDLPKGYQISQYDMPLCQNGRINIGGNEVRIRRIHLEEDTGKLLHALDGKSSLINFNRAGVSLMELVTEPDMHSAKEVKDFAQELQLIFRYIGVSDANMEKGQMRCEANISILPNDKQIITNNFRMNESRIVLKDESYNLMGLMFEIHNKLGPIYKEKNYQDAIEEILKREKIAYERERNIELKFENLKISNFFADFVVDGQILLEIKAKPFITNEDIRQTSRYIKSSNLPLGIIVNFKQQKLEYKRVINPLFEKNSEVFEENSGILGTKVEIKNLNSFKAVERGVDYEIVRQTKLLEEGKEIAQETRGWDEGGQKTFSQRMKESAHDYRYFPEPDLPPLDLADKNYFDLEKIKMSLPELPQQKRERLAREFGLDENSIEFFVQNEDFSDYLEQAISEIETETQERSGAIKTVSNYLISDVAGILKEKMLPVKELLMKPEDFAELICLILKGDISSKIAKQILLEMISTGEDPSHIVDRLGVKQMSNDEDLVKFIEEVIKENPQPVEDLKNGKEVALQFLIGQVMAKTKGRANPAKLKEIIIQKI